MEYVYDFAMETLNAEASALESYYELAGTEWVDAKNNRARVDGRMVDDGEVLFSEVLDFNNQELVYFSPTDEVCSIIAMPFTYDMHKLILELQNWQDSDYVEYKGALTPSWSEEAFFVFETTLGITMTIYADVNTGDIRYAKYNLVEIFMRFDSYQEVKEGFEESLFHIDGCDAAEAIFEEFSFAKFLF
mmetsp:Transcript_12865/g.9317  ORF Transcript_12865/g.9317 Transcript_12865/m.9317 type:complete len:189 (+) Transcript_12865:128-694(+)|eukprot:CAMPEP_0202977448 /NCGR_PEP_ID=MMETSP1396-20130829/84254_1 /ASSEMBLY_ACC=CAM_ASM_000872 /TAXON_ID= /ORGANISM="Pseudokeronopsis sp., Strain Brazil" /LENGTH=188 /DNA_ID=CAMNT_0049716193 /DNA_START=115 /DNA_END=681 /DNA_ORIENTATION=+